MRRIKEDAYVSRSMASRLTGVSADAIGKWHARGWLGPDGEGNTLRRCLSTKRLANGNLLYRVGDILEAERDTEANANSRRGVVKRPVAGPDSWAALDVNRPEMRYAS